LYFNFGNAGKQLCDAKGNLITDIHGVKCTNQNNRPYQDGMVFRCELDGSNVEVLGWNFRNNWEIAVDSFGTLWQSDNDDDGNKGVRINFVMEFGNYGYKDEMTGAGWQTPRLGMEKEIPQRHWHQNDPGVVPNMLLTGAGSPTGMQVYEGNLLPSIFHGQPIHCDAGPNIVRGYITQPDGAGYKAEIVNILEGSKDKWFRPSDVSVAPDGSLIIADWYDPGVGGHGMGDTARGRIFRITTKSAMKYEMPNYKFDTVVGAIEALKSPNESARYLAWIALKGFGDKATSVLEQPFPMTKDGEYKLAAPAHRARALWAVAQHSNVETTQSLFNVAITDTDSNIRITALRAARQLWQQKQPEKLRQLIAKVVKDESPAVRREASIALRFDGSEEANNLWVEVVKRSVVFDRWTIEALGIGEDVRGDARMATLLKAKQNLVPKPYEAEGDQATSLRIPSVLDELIWRHKGTTTASALASMLTESLPSSAWAKVPILQQRLRLLRSLQLLQTKYPTEVTKAALEVFHKADLETSLAAATLLSRVEINKDPTGKARLDELLKPVIGKPAFIDLVERLSLTGFEKELLDFILANPNAPEATTAARLIAANREGAVNFIRQSDATQAKALIAALGRVSDRASVAVLNSRFPGEQREDVRRAIIDALALSGEGGRAILKWHKEGKLPETVKEQAALALSRSTDAGIRGQAASELPVPAAQGLQDFPPLAELMAMKGDPAKGQMSFMQAGCVACHRVKGQFIDFGPDLSQIGSKLAKDGLFTAILYPSAAIEHSFGGQQVTTKDGLTILGYIISDTDEALTLRTAGGAAQVIRKANITKCEELKQSLMPPGLAGTIGAQGLADLAAWLQTLK
ncbi:MAG: PVC-type heme-binding CxxCH protein, partial [Prosthecobacter sp.]|nr:PVC-type heme-binding CxxCH protein [Prosthecobacter sp.]